MLQGEHPAILLTFIKLPCVIKIFVLSMFEWPLKTGFAVYDARNSKTTCEWCCVGVWIDGWMCAFVRAYLTSQSKIFLSCQVFLV